MSNDHETERSAPELLRDLFVYAPIGLLFEAPRRLPDYIEAGKRQLALAEVIGRSTAGVVERRLEAELAPLGRTVAAAAQPLLDLLGLRLPTTYDASAPDGGVDPTDAAHEASEPVVGDALPIADYEDLPAADIVPRLAGLDVGELRRIRSFESANRGRRTILNRVDQLLARAE